MIQDSDEITKVQTFQSVLSTLRVHPQAYPEAQAVSYIFNMAVKACAEHQDVSAAVKNRAISNMTANMQLRFDLLREHQEQFFRIFYQEGSDPIDYEALAIAALCDSDLIYIKPPDEDQTLLHGMEVEHILQAMLITQEARDILGIDSKASDQTEEESDDSEEDQENDDNTPDDGVEIVEQLVLVSYSGQKFPVANDNIPFQADEPDLDDGCDQDQNVSFSAEGILFAHILALEHLHDFNKNFEKYDLQGLKLFKTNDLEAITAFTDTDTDIGKKLWDAMEKTEIRLENKLSPKAAPQPKPL